MSRTLSGHPKLCLFPLAPITLQVYDRTREHGLASSGGNSNLCPCPTSYRATSRRVPNSAAPLPGGRTDLIEEPGFMRGLLDEPLAGLDSFGSEENDSDDNDAELDDVPPPSWNLSQSAPSRGTGQPRPGPVLAAAPSPVAPVDERVPAPEHLPVAGSDPDISTSALLSPADESVGRKASNVSSRALMAPLRWSRAHFNLQVAITVVLTLIGVAEASWLGVRAARGLSGMMRDGAEWPSATGGDSTSRQTMAGSGSEVLVERSLDPASHSTTEPEGPRLGLDLDSGARRGARARESHRSQLERRGAPCAGAARCAAAEPRGGDRCRAVPRHRSWQHDVRGD